MINSTDKIIVEDTSAKATPINVSILIMLTKTHLKVFWTFTGRSSKNHKMSTLKH